MPFDVSPPAWLSGEPHIEQPNFVTWEAPGLPAVRFLAPVTVYPPGDKKSIRVPAAYLPYLLGQTSHGARFTYQVARTIGGRPATMLTATTASALDGSLGCPTATTAAPECFGLQPQLSLRIAVIPVHGTTLLVWLRMPADANGSDGEARRAAFDTMLAGLRFSNRAVAAPTPSSTYPGAGGIGSSVLDGNYVMTISWPQAKKTSADARCVGGPEGDTPKAVYELTLDQGTVRLWLRVGGPQAPREPAFSGLFRVDQDQLTIGDYTATFALHGPLLTLSQLRGGECGDRAIWTTKPWTRQ